MNIDQSHFQLLSQTIDNSLTILQSNFDYSNIRLPILRNSFTLWRTLAYTQATSFPSYRLNPHSDLLFYQMVDCRYLRQFIERLQQAQEALSENGNAGEIERGVEVGVQGRAQMQLVERYSHLLWKHTLYCQLFEDLLALPYLTSLFPPNKKYRLVARYAMISPLRASEKGTEMMEKVSEGILKKGFGELTQKVFTRTFLLRASSIAIRLNPVAIAATFAFSSLFDYYRKQRKQEQITNRLQQLITTCSQNLQDLKRIYEESMGLIGGVLRGQQEARGQLLARVTEVMETDWLQVVRYRDEEQWQVVMLSGDPEGDC